MVCPLEGRKQISVQLVTANSDVIIHGTPRRTRARAADPRLVIAPAAQSLPIEVRDKARSVAGVSDAKVEVVWDPPWTKDRMSDVAKLELGMF